MSEIKFMMSIISKNIVTKQSFFYPLQQKKSCFKNISEGCGTIFPKKFTKFLMSKFFKSIVTKQLRFFQSLNPFFSVKIFDENKKKNFVFFFRKLCIPHMFKFAFNETHF